MSNNLYPKRKPTRLKNYDYSSPGAYFITICTHNREKLLSEIVGEGSPLPPVLTECGKLVDETVRQIEVNYSTIKVVNYIIMPNHIHLLLIISEPDGRRNASPTIDRVIGWLKYHITGKINTHLSTPGQKRFQRSFHDHIIRDDNDFQKIWSYIEYNHLKWSDDCFFVE